MLKFIKVGVSYFVLAKLPAQYGVEIKFIKILITVNINSYPLDLKLCKKNVTKFGTTVQCVSLN